AESAAATRATPKAIEELTRRSPRGSALNWPAMLSISATSPSRLEMRLKNCLPISVGTTLRVVRSSSLTPSHASRSRTLRLTRVVAMFSRLAASVKLPSSTTLTKAFILASRSMLRPYYELFVHINVFYYIFTTHNIHYEIHP